MCASVYRGREGSLSGTLELRMGLVADICFDDVWERLYISS